jgi:hypothetical protein
MNSIRIEKNHKKQELSDHVEWLMRQSTTATPTLDGKANNILCSLLARIIECGENGITLMTDEKYVDKLYRDCYYYHYSNKHFGFNRYCTRVYIFDGEFEYKNQDEAEMQMVFIGCFVIKPTQYGRLGKTLINPLFLFEKNREIYVRTSVFQVLFNGHLLKIDAFPFMMQDEDALSCAEVTVINIMDYFSNQYTNYKAVLPTDIYALAEKQGYQRVLPTHGMTFQLLSKTFAEFGLYPRQLSRGMDLKRILHYYIESGIPLAVGIKNNRNDNTWHSIICIGHGASDTSKMLDSLMSVSSNDYDKKKCERSKPNKRYYIADTADAVDSYVFMDDGASPYQIWEVSEDSQSYNNEYRLNGDTLYYLTIPLYKRMYLEAQTALKFGKEFLISWIEELNKAYFESEHYRKCRCSDEIASENNPVIIRLFLASSKSFLRARVQSFEYGEPLSELYLVLPFPKFVWVCEIYDRHSYNDNEALGEIIIDATASPVSKEQSVIMLNFVGIFLTHDTADSRRSAYGSRALLNKIKECKIKAYTSNLHKLHCY